MRPILLVFIVFSTICTAAQNGTIVSNVPFSFPEPTIERLERKVPELKSILSSVNFYRIAYISDGLRVKGYMAIPKKKGIFPCIIYNRGGNGEYGKITDTGFIMRGLGELAKAGYVIVASQYRGNDGGEGKEELGGTDLNDVYNLVPLLATLPQADTSRIGMFGWSRGGVMSYMALTKLKNIKAAVVGSAPPDLLKALEARPNFDTIYPRLIPGYVQNKTAVLEERSAFYFAEKMNKSTPLLILQGTGDQQNETDNVFDFLRKLYKIKHPYRSILYEGGQHSLIEHRQDYITQIINWFDAYVRDKKGWPSLEPHRD